jgi:hypothetical protein
MKESMRLHPGIGYPLERYVPPGGATLCNRFLPAGTNVGITAPVIHHNKDIYGNDADDFRPERWIESSEEELKVMDRYFLAVSTKIPSQFNRINLSSPIVANYLTNIISIVRLRYQDLHRQEHLHSRDGQTGSASSTVSRCRMGF